MKKTIIYLVRHSEQLKIDGIKNIKEEEQINNEKIILSVNGVLTFLSKLYIMYIYSFDKEKL